MEKTKGVIDDNQLFATTNLNIDKFKKEKRWWDALLLYFAYQQQSRYQKTNQSRSTDKFMIKKMLWGKERFKVAKGILKKLWFIEIGSHRKKGKISEWYVKTNYIMNVALINQNHQKQDSVEWPTNALSSKEKCLKEKNFNVLQTEFEGDLSTNFDSELDKKKEDKRKFSQLFDWYKISKVDIEVRFEYKKPLDLILLCCDYISRISKHFCIVSVYDKDTINAVHILYQQWNLYPFSEFLDKVDNEWVSYYNDSIKDFKDFIRQDKYLPEIINEWYS